MTFRAQLITGEPTLFAPERAARPHAFAGDRDAGRCPFCAGHEEDTPPSLATVGDPWRVRVFPNKYPSIAGAEVSHTISRFLEYARTIIARRVRQVRQARILSGADVGLDRIHANGVQFRQHLSRPRLRSRQLFQLQYLRSPEFMYANSFHIF